MYSRILTKLIAESISPFLGLLFIKIIVTKFTADSLGYSSNLFNIFSLEVSYNNYIQINSNVLFGFVIFCFIGLSYSLLKSIYFHNTHIAPKLSLSVFNLRLGFLIQDSFHLFSQNLIWLLFNFITLFLTTFLFFLGLVLSYILIFSVFLTLIGTYFFILDIEYEMQRSMQVQEDEEIFV